MVADTRREFVAAGSYEEFEYTVKLFANDMVGVQLFWGRVAFIPRWANPLWALLDHDVATS
eukprot:5336878-Lingulodinium_polyedra.AAC.1